MAQFQLNNLVTLTWRKIFSSCSSLESLGTRQTGDSRAFLSLGRGWNTQKQMGKKNPTKQIWKFLIALEEIYTKVLFSVQSELGIKDSARARNNGILTIILK